MYNILSNIWRGLSPVVVVTLAVGMALVTTHVEFGLFKWDRQLLYVNVSIHRYWHGMRSPSTQKSQCLHTLSFVKQWSSENPQKAGHLPATFKSMFDHELFSNTQAEIVILVPHQKCGFLTGRVTVMKDPSHLCRRNTSCSFSAGTGRGLVCNTLDKTLHDQTAHLPMEIRPGRIGGDDGKQCIGVC